MARKLLLVFASFTLVVAGVALYFSLSKPAASAGPTKTVLMAVGDLPPGTRVAGLRETDVQSVQVAANLAPPNAMTSLAAVAQFQTLTPIFRGQVLVPQMFASSASTGGLSIPMGTNAVTLQLTDPGRVAGFVQPGSHAILYRIADSSTPGEVVLPDVRVIAVGPTTETGTAGDAVVSNKTAPTTLVTFALSPKQSVKVIGRQDLALGLLPTP